MMQGLIPWIRYGGWSSCDHDDRSYEGRYLSLGWLTFTLEIGVGRRERARG